MKENEQLKEKDKQREKESNEIKRRCEAEVLAVRDEYKGKGQLLDYYTDLQKKKIGEYNRKISEQDKYIEESAELKYKKRKICLDKKYDKKNANLKAVYIARNTALNTQLFSSILYAAIVTLLMAAKSDVFKIDILKFLTTFTNIIIKYGDITIKAGKSTAVISTRIDNIVIQNILYWLIFLLISAIILSIPIIIAFLSAKKYITWYKEEISDSISLWVAVIVLALTIFFSEEIKQLIPVNLILLNIIAHLSYSGFRAYVRGCKRYRGY
ncbi:MAG: hypothetical protein IKS48_02605 [Eubacterium sp.]|nr:hypothetical protein [Eubacterium sp.]